MSLLYHSAISARIAELPSVPPSDGDEGYDEADEIADSLGLPPSPGKMGSPRLLPAPACPRLVQRDSQNLEHAPIRPDAYGQYFTQALRVELPTRGLVVRTYHITIHGSGVMIMHHGAGYSTMSFACLAKELNETIGKDVGVLAFDARRHGQHSVLLGSHSNFILRVWARPSHSDEGLSMDDLVVIVQTVF